jgi:hypothetical protein
MKNINDMANANNLIHAHRRAQKASGWKEPVQRYGCNMLRETRKLQRDIMTGKYKQTAGTTFRICEQGHLRLIRAPTVRDMVAQHALCDGILVPELTRYLIHDNGASQTGKGISFTRRRFEQHLRQHYRKYGTDGYVLMIDFRKFFDNIKHGKLIEKIRERINDEHTIELIRKIMSACEIDVSYSDDPHIIDRVFNSLEYERIPREELTGKRWMKKSLGIGLPISQIAGIYFPTEIDTYCKTVMKCRGYDVYMDDRIIIHPDKEYLKTMLDGIREISHRLGLHINEHKTQIVKLSHGFTFLKTRYILTESGKIIRKIPRPVVVRQRRKMKKLAQIAAAGEMTLDQFRHQYISWRGDKRRYNAHITLITMDKLYRRLTKWIIQTLQKKNKSKSSRSGRKSAT